LRWIIAILLTSMLCLTMPSTSKAADIEVREQLRKAGKFSERLGLRQDPKEREKTREKQRDDQQRWTPEPGQNAASRAAAAKAERRYGGRALAVVPFRDGHKVRLLLEGGRVTTVFIQD
jgi:hypothetical protein